MRVVDFGGAWREGGCRSQSWSHSSRRHRHGPLLIGRGAGVVDMRLEVVVIPVSDVDRAKEFYGSLGWRLDADFPFDNGFRVVQFTPPGSGWFFPLAIHAAL